MTAPAPGARQAEVRLTRDDLRAPPGQRAPGPLRLPAMAWLLVALLPWKVFWLAYAVGGRDRALLAGTSVALVLLLVREATRSAAFLERATALVFTSATVAARVCGGTAPGILGASFLALAAIWTASVVHRRHPLTAEYSRWNYAPLAWNTTPFRHANALLTLVWGGIFTVLAVLGAAGERGWTPHGLSAGLSVAICLAGGVFTRRREAAAPDRRLEDLDASLGRLVGGGRVLLAVIAAGFLLTGDPGTLSGWLLVPAAALLGIALWPARS